jgi:membrane protease YdiL (CAAX protease family)
MADFMNIGNSLFAALIAGCAWVWVRIGIRAIQRQPPLELAPQQPASWPSVPACATFLVAFLLPAVIVHWAGPFAPLSLGKVQWNCLAQLAQLLTIPGLLAINAPLRREDFGCDLTTWRRDVLTGTGAFLASLAPVFLVTIVQAQHDLRGPDDKHLFFKILDSSSGSGIVAWIVFAVVVVAPVTEELTYRVLLQGWAQGQMRPWQAILFSSTVFAVAHDGYDRLPLLPLAVILGYVYWRRRSYLAVVVLHSLFNAANLALALLRKE